MNTPEDVLRLVARTVALVDQMLAKLDRPPTLDPWTVFELKAAVGRLRARVSAQQGDRKGNVWQRQRQNNY